MHRIFLSHRRTSTGHNVACVLNPSETQKNKTWRLQVLSCEITQRQHVRVHLSVISYLITFRIVARSVVACQSAGAPHSRPCCKHSSSSRLSVGCGSDTSVVVIPCPRLVLKSHDHKAHLWRDQRRHEARPCRSECGPGLA